MGTSHAGASGYRVSILDEDPLRARREARELLAALAEVDPQVALDVSGQASVSDTDKGGPVTDLIGLVFSGGSLAAAGIQVWLARVPQRTVVVTRPDGATLRITGKETRNEEERIERFLDGTPADSDEDGPGAE
ncbi:hypothetical protein [Streptomyces sp. NBC_01089]|uniref:effector-associated constant component EACC1 n=1 Tax=Streptomyces sp. NBC_01089 TaxID=2903747 RepID=UPI00386D32C8|nr:hypothetical protein OG510_08370 [Streptomyces sp. NBC_01089]